MKLERMRSGILRVNILGTLETDGQAEDFLTHYRNKGNLLRILFNQIKTKEIPKANLHQC